MKRLIPFLLIAALGAPFAAAAQSDEAPPAPAPATNADDASEPAQSAAQDSQQAKKKDLPASPYCLRDTGSLIRQTSNRPRCTGFGSTYSREDLQRTGATDIGDALRRLDSSIH